MSTLPSTFAGPTEPHIRVFPAPNPQPEQTAPNANTQVNGDTKVKHAFSQEDLSYFYKSQELHLWLILTPKTSTYLKFTLTPTTQTAPQKQSV